MKRSKSITVASLLALSMSAVALDLTPRKSFRELEGGVKIPLLEFQDDTRKAQYVPPGGWDVSGGGPSLEFRSPEFPKVKVTVRCVPRTATSGAIQAGDPNELERWVIASLPANAEGLTKTAVNESPFMLGPTPSREFQFAFRTADGDRNASITVLDLGDRQRLVLEIIGAPKYFTGAREAMIRSFFSWEWQG